MSIDETHIQHCMLYEFKKGQTAAAATKSICEVYGNHILNVQKCQRWFLKFRSGNFDLSDNARSGHPSEVSNEDLKVAVESDPRKTVRELADMLNTSHTSVLNHLKE